MVIGLASGWEIMQGDNALPMMRDELSVSSTTLLIASMRPMSALRIQNASTIPPISHRSTSQPDSPLLFWVGPTPSGVMTLSNRYLVKACDTSCRKTMVRIILNKAAGKCDSGLILAYEMSSNLTLAYLIKIRTHCLCLSNQTVIDSNFIQQVVTLWHSSP